MGSKGEEGLVTANWMMHLKVIMNIVPSRDGQSDIRTEPSPSKYSDLGVLAHGQADLCVAGQVSDLCNSPKLAVSSTGPAPNVPHQLNSHKAPLDFDGC